MTERITEVVDVWIAWTNTDCTEGRGKQIPHAICRSEATAHRLGEGKSVQGSNCRVTKDIGVHLEGRGRALYVPGIVNEPTDIDKSRDNFLAKKRKVTAKALDAGLSHEDIEILKSG